MAAPVPSSRRPSRWRALRHHNYRLFFAGQGLSLIGTWITRIATNWLVFRLTDSALVLGVTAFVGQLPILFLGPIAGVWVDRWDRHRTLIATQALAMVQSALLAFFALSGTIGVVHIIALNAFQGLINAFDTPARQAFVVELLEEREDLPNAIALNSSMVNAARLLGPSVAGLLIASVGEGYCFLIDAVSYIAVIASLLAMRVEPRTILVPLGSVRDELREGLHYIWDSTPIRWTLLLLASISLMGMPLTVLMPAMVREVLGGSAQTLGFLMSASGCGALVGALQLASRSSVLGLGRVIGATAIAFGASLVAFALCRVYWLSLLLMFASGLSMMMQMAASNTVLQTIVDEDKRGRVMSFYAMAFFGTAPIGSLLAGVVADRIGVPGAILIGGLPCIAGGLLFLRELPRLRAVVRPIYVRLGILE